MLDAGLLDRQRHDESRALVGPTVCINLAIMALDDLAAGRQADAGAFVLAAAVQALEDREDLVLVLVVEADAVVGNREAAEVADGATARDNLSINAHDRLAAGLAELQRVANQVLQQLAHLRRIGIDRH